MQHNQSNHSNNKFIYIFGLITLIYIATCIMIESEKQEPTQQKQQEQFEEELKKEKEQKFKEQQQQQQQQEEKKEFNKQMNLNNDVDIKFKENDEKINEDHKEEDEEEEDDEDERNSIEGELEYDEEENEGEEESIEQFSMFGVSIEKLMEFQRQEDAENGEDIDDQDESNRVPIVLSFMLDRIKNLNGFETEGLFRINGNLKLVEQLATEGFDPFSDDLDTNVHTWASLLKKWIRDLPEPIIPFELNSKIIEICNNNNSIIEYINNNNNNCNNSKNQNQNEKEINESIEKIITNILELIKPDDHKFVLYRIGLFFGELLQDENVEKTKMTLENLSKIITPSLFKPNNILPDGRVSPNQLPKFVTTLDFSNIMLKQKKEIEFVQLFLVYFKNQYFKNKELELNLKKNNLNDQDNENEDIENNDEEFQDDN